MSSRFLKHSLVIRASLDGMELRIILRLCYILAKQPVLLILPEPLSYCINIDILEMHCIIKSIQFHLKAILNIQTCFRGDIIGLPFG